MTATLIDAVPLLRELEQLRGFMRTSAKRPRQRPFVPTYLRNDTVETLQRLAHHGPAVWKLARREVEAALALAQRAHDLQPLEDRLRVGLGRFVTASIPPATAERSARSLLASLLTDAFTLGAQTLVPDYEPTTIDTALLDDRIAEESSYLASLIADVRADRVSPAQLTNRLTLWSQQLRGAYEAGKGAGARAAVRPAARRKATTPDDPSEAIDVTPEDGPAASRLRDVLAEISPDTTAEEAFGFADRPAVRFTWVAVGDKDTCDYCAAQDGQEFTADELDDIGWPGDAGFGNTTSGCYGGPLCRCIALPSDLTKALIADVRKYSEEEERDERGRWAGSGSDAGSALEQEPTIALHLEGDPLQTGPRIAPTTERAWGGTAIDADVPPLSKQDVGKLGEAIVLQHLAALDPTVRPFNDVHNNTPIDILGHSQAIEVKTGLATNGPSAQQWRATIGQPGKAETAWMKTLTPEQLRAHNQAKSDQIMERKANAVRTVSAEAGHDIAGRTVTVILNPATHVADVYEFNGFHPRIAWNSAQAKAGYVRSYHYEVAAESRKYSEDQPRDERGRFAGGDGDSSDSVQVPQFSVRGNLEQSRHEVDVRHQIDALNAETMQHAPILVAGLRAVPGTPAHEAGLRAQARIEEIGRQQRDLAASIETPRPSTQSSDSTAIDDVRTAMEGWMSSPQVEGTGRLNDLLQTPAGQAFTRDQLSSMYQDTRSGIAVPGLTEATDHASFSSWYEHGTMTVWRGEQRQAYSTASVSMPLQSWTPDRETAVRFARGEGSGLQAERLATPRLYETDVPVRDVVGAYNRSSIYGNEYEILLPRSVHSSARDVSHEVRR